MRRSHVFSLKKIAEIFSGFMKIVSEDRVTVYAAQASFFIIISSVPFLLLVLSLSKYFVDTEWLIDLVESRITGTLGDIIKTVIGEVFSAGSVPILSLTIVTTLWTASRGVNSVTRGIGDIYGIRYHEIFLIEIVRALIYTVLFVLIIVGSIIMLMFANTITDAVGDSIIFTPFIIVIRRIKGLIFVLVLTLFFAFLFNTVSKKGKRLSKEHYESMSDKLPRGIKYQLPGAAFAAAGWVLFSYFYSLYLAYFPTGYYLYGSLAAALLLMLWMYTCMNILLIGAEINKQIFQKRMFGKRKVINK